MKITMAVLRFRFLLFLCLIACSSGAQTYKVFKGDTINRVDANGKKQGLWRKYYETDTLFSEGIYKDGFHTGVFKTFQRNGRRQSLLKFRGRTEISDAELFNENGDLMAKGKYIDHLKDSTWIYFDEEGKKNAEENYSKGKKTGMWKIFYQNGKVSRQITYKNDKKTGDYKEFFDSGSPKITGKMIDDNFEGPVIIYHPDGKIWQSGVYKKGVKDGVWKIFKEDGTPEREDIYKSGNLLNPSPEGD